MKIYYQNNRQKRLDYWQNNRQKKLDYYQDNREKILQRHKRYRDRIKEKILQRQRERYHDKHNPLLASFLKAEVNWSQLIE